MAILTEKLGWVILHSVWQLAICGLLAWIFCRLLRSASASARYAFLMSSMVMAVLTPVVTWNCLEVRPVTTPTVARVVEFEAIGLNETASNLAEPFTSGLPITASTPTEPFVPQVSESLDASSPGWQARAVSAVEPWLPGIVTAWIVGVVLFSIRLILSWATVWRLQFAGTSAVSDSVRQSLQKVKDKLGVRRAIRILESRLVDSPLVVGCFRATILIPTGLISGISVTQLEAILAHEIAHVRRFDYITNLLQTLIETLFFYHPFVWWLSRRVREERENCCDDVVVRAMSNRADYGRALLAIEEFRTAAVAPSTLAMSAKGGSLVIRIRRLLNDPPDSHKKQTGGLFLAALLLLTASVGSFWLAVAAGANETEPRNKTAVASDLSLRPDEKTDYTSEQDAGTHEKSKFIAKLSGGRSIEFIGIRKHNAPADKAWRPDGLMGDSAHLGWFPRLSNEEAPARNFLFAYSGFQGSLQVRVDLPTNSGGMGLSRAHIGRGHLQVTESRPKSTLLYNQNRWGKPGAIKLWVFGVAARWVKINLDGTIPNPPHSSELGYKDFANLKISPAAMKNEDGVASAGLNILHPAGWQRKYEFGFRSWWEKDGVKTANISSTGKVHDTNGETQWMPRRGDGTLTHFEIRLQPFTDSVTFENIVKEGPTTEPSDVKVSVDSLIEVGNSPQEQIDQGVLDPAVKPAKPEPAKPDVTSEPNPAGTPKETRPAAIAPQALVTQDPAPETVSSDAAKQETTGANEAEPLTYRGTVVDSEGQPVAGAHVIAQRLRLDRHSVGSARHAKSPHATTDSKGRFEIFEPGVPGLHTLLWVYADNFGQSVTLAGEYSESKLTKNLYSEVSSKITLPPAGKQVAYTVEQAMGIQGRQYDDRNLIPDVKVEPASIMLPDSARVKQFQPFLWEASVPEQLREHLSSVSGDQAMVAIPSTFRISTFTVARPNQPASEARRSVHKPEPLVTDTGSIPTVDIAVGRTARVRGRIINYSKLKDAGLRLRTDKKHGVFRQPVPIRKDGTFQLESRFGMQSFEAELAPDQPYAIRQITSRSTYCYPNETTDFLFEVVPAATLTGRVVTEDGAPVANATLRVTTAPLSDDIRATKWYIDRRYFSVKTNRSGRYSLFIPPSSRRYVSVVKLPVEFSEDYEPADARLPLSQHITDVRILSGQTHTLPDLVLRPQQMITATLTEPDGTPVGGVSVESQRFTRSAKRNITTTDDVGQFQIAVSPLWLDALKNRSSQSVKPSIYVRRPGQTNVFATMISESPYRFEIKKVTRAAPAHEDSICEYLEVGIPPIVGSYTLKELTAKMRRQAVRFKLSDKIASSIKVDVDFRSETYFSALKTIREKTGLRYEVEKQTSGMSGSGGYYYHPIKITLLPANAN